MSTPRAHRCSTGRPVREDALRRLAPRGDDSGAALVSVLGMALVLTLLATASLTFVRQQISYSRTSQDRGAALAAAQAGVDDYLARLNECDGYWQSPCNASEVNPALGGWAALPGSDPGTPGVFTYKTITTPKDKPGILEVEVTGRIGNGAAADQKRTIVAQLRKRGFLNFIYYTDVESLSPAAMSEFYPKRFSSSAVAYHKTDKETSYKYGDVVDATWDGFADKEDAKRLTDTCGRRYWEVGADRTVVEWGRATRPEIKDSKGKVTQKREAVTIGLVRSCDILFGKDDAVRGPMHTNDAIYLQEGALFQGKVTSSWPSTATPPGVSSKLWRPWGSAGAKPSTKGVKPVYADQLALPPNNQDLRRNADVSEGGRGCVFHGPTRITFLDDGKLRVHSPATKGGPAECGGGKLKNPAVVDGPTNGVLYVDPDTTTTGTCPDGGQVLYRGAADIGFPEVDRVTGRKDMGTYDCREGIAFVGGKVSGRFTVGTAGRVVVVDDLEYVGGPSGGDVLGLVANNNVEVYHPVFCAVTLPPGEWCAEDDRANVRSDQVDALQDAERVVPGADVVPGVLISAAILSVNRSFQVQNYDAGAPLRDLKVYGGIYQRHRGTVARGGGGTTGTGYEKDYRYDDRLPFLPPPFFLMPQDASWEVAAFSEEKA